MAETKTKVTIVGTVLAKPGVEFVYEGESPECGTCKIKKACNNLNKGHRYRIITSGVPTMNVWSISTGRPQWK